MRMSSPLALALSLLETGRSIIVVLDPQRRVLADGPSRPARLALARAVQLTLGSGLRLLGISVPERLERESE